MKKKELKEKMTRLIFRAPVAEQRDGSPVKSHRQQEDRKDA